MTLLPQNMRKVNTHTIPRKHWITNETGTLPAYLQKKTWNKQTFGTGNYDNEMSEVETDEEMVLKELNGVKVSRSPGPSFTKLPSLSSDFPLA